MPSKWDTMPKPVISDELALHIRQTNAVVNYAEAEGDLILMIQAMKERAELLRQAVRESSPWQFATTGSK